jgi:DNA-binding PadR family transcriptional regulator
LRQLSELEGVSLGTVHKYQSCTAYRVRCELKDAPSSYWRASAGSVYPLLARLEEEGLVASKLDENDGRGRKLLSVTAKGRKSLKNWIMAGVEQGLLSSVTDPIRSRAFFLDVLSRAKQIEYLDEVITSMESYLAETRTYLESKSETDDLYEYLGSLGAMNMTAARLDWLNSVREHIIR